MSGPRTRTETDSCRRLTKACVLDALLALSEAAFFALLEEHPDLELRPAARNSSSTHADIDVEARRLLDLLVELEDVARRYAALADPDDDIPF